MTRKTRVYVEAFYADGSEILGNGEGQGLLQAANYQRTTRYKNLWAVLAQGKTNADHYKIVTASGTVIETITKAETLPHPNQQ